MKLKSCDAIRIELSARIDDQVEATTSVLLDEHLSDCADCRAFEESLHSLRRLMRIQSSHDFPDLTEGIRTRVALERTSRRSDLFGHLRAAGLAAAVTVLLLLGASLPRFGGPQDTANAGEIARGIRAAARALTSYRATFEVVEHNFSRELPIRNFTASVSYQAPERLSLRVDDRTQTTVRSYRPQDYQLIAGPRRWSAVEPSECVPQPVSPCPAKGSPLQTSMVHRQPFDMTALVPTDMILPLESVASVGDLRLLGESEIGDRLAYGVEISAAEAGPLLRSLDPFEVWRPVHPSDRVRIWLDATTWFPLSFEVIAGSSEARFDWAARIGLADEPGEEILQASSSSFTELAPSSTPVPSRARSTLDGRFEETAFAPVAVGPAFTAGLDPYRAGRTGSGDQVAAYAKGTSWLRVSAGKPQRPSIGTLLQSDEVATAVGFTYYTPASTMSSRRIDVYGVRVHLRIESNLPRATLLRVAESAQVEGLRQAQARSADALTRRASPSLIRERFPFAAFPSNLPPGYELAGSFMTVQSGLSDTISLYYRRAEIESSPVGIRITQVRDFDMLPPTSEDPVVVDIGGNVGRWSIERGELEWVDDGTYRAITAPGYDLELALRIALSL